MAVRTITGDQAVAYGAMLARTEVVPGFPITPQTIIIEQITELINDGLMDADFIAAESEHSVMSVAVGASAGGVRTFTCDLVAGPGPDVRDAVRRGAHPPAGGHGRG